MQPEYQSNNFESESKQKNRESEQLQQEQLYKFYKKSQSDGSGRFKLRFKQIQNSLVDANPFSTAWSLAKWKWDYWGKEENWPKDPVKLEQELKMVKPTFQTFENKIVYTWIGHSTAVISLGKNFNIIIDPVFAERASPNQYVGPKRFRPPACKISQLPQIHLVLVSHDHYDHLDSQALKDLYKRFPQANFVAGLGSKDVFPKGCKFTALDWTQSYIFNNGDLKVTFVPVCHWGRRGAFDKNMRLWGGFVIETKQNKRRLFYSGDTGKCGVFQQLGKIFKQFDLCILPIGAYEPRKYLSNQHINPEQAVQIHKQMNSKKSVGVHWGTFPLGSQHYTAARSDLKIATQKYKLKEDEFITVDHGGSFQIDY